ncbi:hypothetical protein PINS_up003262 [Pythium insidiosum]|nr:hypothetical protein PINS_up003262 [Pythium insidiosum]
MAIRLVTDFTRYPYQEIPPLVFHNLRYEQVAGGAYKYLPSMYLDDMGLTMEKLVPLNATVRALPLQISFEPMSYARWQVLLTMEAAFKSQEALGFTSQDIDGMRAMIAETNPYLLAITMTVSLLHILFDWLAFKNDISDWRQRRSAKEMVGVSLRAMIISLVSQFIVSSLDPADFIAFCCCCWSSHVWCICSIESRSASISWKRKRRCSSSLHPL